MIFTNIKKKFKKNYWIYVLLISGFIIPNIVFAGSFDAWIGRVLAQVIYLIAIWPLGLLIKLELWILPMIASFNNFTGLDPVIDGWRILRDLSNMLFIIVFLVIAFATILKIQSYGYQQLLKRFIIIAILINFSKTIVGFVIDFFQIIMLTFVASIKDIAAGNIVNGLGIGSYDQFSTTIEQQSNFFTVVAAALLLAIMMLISIVVIGMFIAALTARIVQIWIYVVLSPLAFFASTFPGGKKYWDQWIGEFSKALLIGPVIAFFLWLSFTFMSTNISTNFIEDSDDAAEVELTGLTAAAQPNHMINFIIGISILIFSLKIAKDLGAVGAGAAIGLIDKAKSGAASMGKRAAQGAAKRSVGAAAGAFIDKEKGGFKSLKDMKSDIKGVGKRLVTKEGWKKTGKGVYGATVGRAGAAIEAGFTKVYGREQTRQATLREESKKGVLDTHREGFIKNRDKAAFGSGWSAEVDKMNISKGNFNNEDVPDMIENLQRVGNETSLTKLASMSPEVLNPDLQKGSTDEERIEEASEKARSNIQEHGFDGVTKDLRPEFMVDQDGNPTEGTKILAEVLVKDENTSSKNKNKKLDKLPEAVATILRKEMASVKIEGDFSEFYDKGNKKFDKNSTEGKISNARLNSRDANIRKEEISRLETQVDNGRSKIEPPVLPKNPTAEQKVEYEKKAEKHETMKQDLKADRAALSEYLGSVIDNKSLAKMNPKSEDFKKAVKGKKPGDIAELCKTKGMSSDHIEVIVDLQIDNDNIKEMLLNAVTRPYVKSEAI